MYLKNLQLLGFKSFADKTSVEFLPGVTCIVGPNGCGKSNVSDAIRWVLGEQSAKALRGGEMADVIFNGTDSRKALGMCEVSLTFADCKDVLKTGQITGEEMNFDEVTVTRRIFRDGNSEYLINRVPCRLRDIQGLFMDTGIGRSSYSIMEQGKIDKILSAHPDDRRAIFEEAAGITKFKSQKKEALRKFEYTEANLLRVQDVIKEVKRQINSLQRQVSKARRYQRLMLEVKHLDAQVARHEYDGMSSALLAMETETQTLKASLEDIRLEIEAGEGNISNLREQLTETENQRQQILQQQREMQSEWERLETRVRTHSDRITETHASIESAEREISEARSRSISIEDTLTVTRQELGQLRDRQQEQEGTLQQSQQSLLDAEAIERKHAAEMKDLQQRQIALEGTLAKLTNQASVLEKERSDFENRTQKLSMDRVRLSDEKQSITQKMNALSSELQSYKHTFEASRHAVQGNEQELHNVELECQTLIARISEEQRKLSEKTSRRDVLKQLQESYEGYSEGARALLKEHLEKPQVEGNHFPREEVLGALVGLIQVDEKYTRAIEAALGQRMESIVVSSASAAMHLTEQLRNRELGRALFAIREFAPTGGSLHLHREPLDGTLRWAGDVVQCQPEVESLIRTLLADTVIVPELNQGFEFRRQNPGMTVVTLEGDILDHHGVLSAGARKFAQLQLIGQRNEIAALDIEIQRLENLVHEFSSRKGEMEGRRAMARQSLGDRQSDLRFQENDLTKKEALLGALQNELKEHANRLTAVEMELHEIERAQIENASQQTRIRAERSQADNDRQSLETQLAESTRRAEELVANRQQKGAVANDLRVAVATLKEQIQSLEARIQPLEKQLQEARLFGVTRENDVKLARQKILQWEGEIAEANRLMESLKVNLHGIAGRIAEVDERKNGLSRDIEGVMTEVRKLRARVDEIQTTLTEMEVKLTEKRGDRTHLVDRISREYQIQLETVHALPLVPPSSRPEQPRIRKKSVEPKEGESPSGESTSEENSQEVSASEVLADMMTELPFENWDEVGLRVAELRAKLQSMGPVNMEAVQEFEELEQRFQFLTREHDDLVTSKDQLQEIIRKINVTTRKMFAETFDQIRENFKTVFTELFGGGKADLILMDDTDPLECGIEIVAKPPGKQLQSIQLLSGGERTMTAVSLLFAIYQVKPSPFCVLDEMDAPLDESNINRFVKMLERFLTQSQFIIITHNKRTIGMGDALYGVTMEERGVSRLISVRFNRTEGDSGASNRENKPKENQGRLLVDAPSLES